MNPLFPSEGELQARGITSAGDLSAVVAAGGLNSRTSIDSLASGITASTASQQAIDARVHHQHHSHSASTAGAGGGGSGSGMDSISSVVGGGGARPPPGSTTPTAAAAGAFATHPHHQTAVHSSSFPDYYGAAATMFNPRSSMDFQVTSMNNNYLFPTGHHHQGVTSMTAGQATNTYMDIMNGLPGAAAGAIGNCSRMTNGLGSPMYPWMAIVGEVYLHCHLL